MWLVRAGRGGENLDDFVSLGIVCFNDKKLGKLSTGITKEDLLKLYAEHYPEAKEGSRASWASQIARLINEVKIGDDVATWDPDRRRYLLGKVTSAYEWIPREGSEAAHARRVEWTRETPRDALSVTTKNTLGSVLTVFKLNPEAEADLVANAGPLNSTTPTTPTKSPVKEENSEKLLEVLHAGMLRGQRGDGVHSGLKSGLSFHDRCDRLPNSNGRRSPSTPRVAGSNTTFSTTYVLDFGRWSRSTRR